MDLEASQTQAVAKKEWHSTYYKLMKAFVNDVLNLSEGAAGTTPINKEKVASVLREAAQLDKVINNYQSQNEPEEFIVNIAANNDKLNVTKPAEAAAKYKGFLEKINANRAEVNKNTTERAALTEKVKEFQDEKKVALEAITAALNKDDISGATSLLNDLASKADKLKKEIKTIKENERKLMDNLNTLRNDVVTVVRTITEEIKPPRPAEQYTVPVKA